MNYSQEITAAPLLTNRGNDDTVLYKPHKGFTLFFFNTRLFQLWSKALQYMYFKGIHSLTLHNVSTDLSIFEYSLLFSQTEQDIVLLTVCWIRLKLFPWELYACSNRILSSMLHSSGVW